MSRREIIRSPGPLTRDRCGHILALLRERTLEESIEDAYDILDRAERGIKAEGKTLAGIWGLYSGGNDSTAFMHLMREYMDGVIHVNTGIGIQETRDFVRKTCADWGLELREYTPEPGSGNTYRELVLKYGFPGPAGHSLMYRHLKERQIRRARADIVTNGRNQRVIFLSGLRVFESERRYRNAEEHNREGSIVFTCPLVHWTPKHMKDYRRLHDVPRNPVSDHLHMSGECLCGAFAKPNELEEIRFFYPSTACYIETLQKEAAAAGKHAVWGTRPPRQPKVLQIEAEKQHLCRRCVDGVEGVE